MLLLLPSEYLCHVYVRNDDLSAVVIADHEYPQRVCFTLLDKVGSAATQTIWNHSLCLDTFKKFKLNHFGCVISSFLLGFRGVLKDSGQYRLAFWKPRHHQLQIPRYSPC